MVKIKLVLRIIGGLLLAAFSAGLLLLALSPNGLWPFALIGLASMLFAQYRVLPLRLANLAPAIGIGGFIGQVIGEVALGTANTPQVVLGDCAGWLCLIGPIGFMLLAPIRKMWARATSRLYVAQSPNS